MPQTKRARGGAAKYRVGNLRGDAPKGAVIIRCGERCWYAGDILDVAEANAAARVTVDIDRYLRKGHLEEVK